jgi:hypothetical protein
VHSAVVHDQLIIHVDERPIIRLSVEFPCASLGRLEEAHGAVTVIVSLVSNMNGVDVGHIQSCLSVDLLEDVRLGNSVKVSIELGEQQLAIKKVRRQRRARCRAASAKIPDTVHACSGPKTRKRTRACPSQAVMDWSFDLEENRLLDIVVIFRLR